MSRVDSQSLFTMIVAFFLQGDKTKKNELLTKAHVIIENLERHV